MDHAAHHGIGLVGAEGGEGLAIQILRGLDGGVGRQCAPNGARLLLHLQHLLDVSALQRVDAHVGQVGQGEVGHTVVHGLFGTGLGHGHDIHVKAGVLEVALVLGHVHADVVGIGCPGKHESDLLEVGGVGVGGVGGVGLATCGETESHGKGAHEGSGLGYKAFLHNDGSLIRCLSIVLWDCFERKSAENDMEGLDFRSTSAPDIPYESSGKPVCHTLVKLFHYRDRVGDLMRSRAFSRSWLPARAFDGKKELLVRVGVFVVAGRAEQDALAGVYRQHQYACHQDNDDGGGEDQRRAE